MYFIDTGTFYSNHEKYLHDMNCKYRRERNYINNKLAPIEETLLQAGYSRQDLNYLKRDKLDKLSCPILPEHQKDIDQLIFLNKLIIHKRKKAHQSKKLLLSLLSHKVEQNIQTGGKDHIRQVREQDLHDSNIISVFESSLTRTIGILPDDLTDDLIVVQVYYFDVFKDIAFYGFTYKGEKYKYFTSSAGQIRKKKAVFIKESTWDQIEKTIMCGLTIDKINAKGGNNANKHLAYMALANSATDEWKDFDIDRCIVVDDFETNVQGVFDFIDDVDYSITRRNGEVPIPHTDGVGMILPSVMTKNTMFRAPWIKGLLGVYDYIKMIKVNGYSPIIKDIYGKEWNVIDDKIEIIFTKSQFKMWKYYDSWQSYKDYFKKYHCQAGLCNTEEDRIKNSKINYQMLQTLTNITDDEIDQLTKESSNKIKNICTSIDSMMKILGVTPYNTNLTPFQKALKIYPALLNDTYAKDILRDVKNSLLKKYRSGKLEINGKYTFLLPDFYAACEYWFGHIENPNGLLKDKEVFCYLFKKYEKLDCLRSPHLYKEHAVRFNVAHKAYEERAMKIREWFTTDGLYTSTHDLISRILQFDVDGDKSLVVADPLFVSIAERNMNGIVPLFYNMKKAEPTKITNESIYKGLNSAFIHGNIGLYSNNISKIWNSNVFINGSDTDQQVALNCVKLLCMENNFCIDAAKTLYMPTRPSWFTPIVSKFTNKKLPAFFEYAKDKDKKQVEERNNSFVNKLYERIKNTPINTRRLKLPALDYRKLMHNPNMICSKDVSALYETVSKEYSFQVNMKDEYIDNLRYLACNIRSRFNELGYSDETIADMLVQKVYGKESRRKQILWFCYGQYIVNNLENNIGVPKTKYVQCVDCGEWFEVGIRSKSTRCPECQKEFKKGYQAALMRKRRKC